MKRLENWSVESKPYYDTDDGCLSGEVYGDPDRPDGRRVTTTHIVAADGRNVRTASGSTYVLGEPSEGYREWLRVNRPDWDPLRPIAVIVEGSKKKFATTHN